MSPKILFTASSYSHIATFHRPYLRAFHELGWEVHVACGGKAIDIPEADRCIFVPYEKSMTSPKNLAVVCMLRREIRREEYDLLSCHTSLAAFFSRLAVLGLKKRPVVVNTAHGYLFDNQTGFAKRMLLLGAEKMTAGVTDLLMTMNSWDTALAQREKLGRQITEIPGIGVDFARFDRIGERERAELRETLGASQDCFLLLYAAEFSARKNQQMLIRALPLLPERVRLLLPGTGVLEEDCRALASSLGVADRAIFPGYISDMPRWYACADAAVSASRSEGLPFNIMEAMYCHLPTVASNVKGHSDLIDHGVSGLLYPYDDAEAFAACVRRLLNDPDGARRLALAGHESVYPYALERVLPLVMSAYAKLPGLSMKEPEPALR